MALSLSEGSAHRCLAPYIMSGHCQWEHGKEALHGGQETKKERARLRHALQSHVPYELLLQLGSSSQNNATARNCMSHK